MFSKICSESIFRNTKNSIIPRSNFGRKAGINLKCIGFHKPINIPAIRNNQKCFSIKLLILIC